MKVNRVVVSRLTSVFDGDTFRCDIDTWPKLFGYKIPVRVRGIDCPERNSSDAKTKKRSTQAMIFTRAALMNAKKIELVNIKRGKYFRLIADVEYDGRSLASDLLRVGLATIYRK